VASSQLPLMYSRLAPWFHLLTSPASYEPEAEIYLGVMQEYARRPLETLLELGSGGGNNASHYKNHVRATLVDLSEDMLALSRSINPECEHIRGDMRTVRLGRTFDAVFVHDAVAYMLTPEDLAAAMETAFEHLTPGGVALFAPDCTRETLVPETRHGGHDDPDGRALRYLEWTHDAAPGDTSYDVDYAIVLREADGATRVEYDRHTCGVFPRAQWLELLRAAGFEPALVERRLVDEDGTYDLELFVGVRPG